MQASPLLQIDEGSTHRIPSNVLQEERLSTAEAPRDLLPDDSSSETDSVVDSEISSVVSTDNADYNLAQSLREWTVNHNVTHSALKDLLLVLQQSGLDVPGDPRTLMQTPRMVNVSRLSGGSFVYFGIEEKISNRVVRFGYTNYEDPLTLNIQKDLQSPLISISVGIDGVPISRSSNKQFWPILCYVDQVVPKNPFVAGIFFGECKPKDFSFLDPLVQECLRLENQGIIVNATKYSFRVSKLLADAPARSFLKACKNHNSYFGCERCDQEGEWDGHVYYPDPEGRIRDDQSYSRCMYDNHQVGLSPFSKLTIGLITQVPLDYLHLVCLGVGRKQFRQWVKGKAPFKLRSRDTLRISDRLLNIRKFLPSVFQRRPRSLVEIDHFKATEFRTLILYTGVVVLRNIIAEEEYRNFLCLHVAMFILLSSKASEPFWNNLSKNLLEQYVTKSCQLYGRRFCVYNVHGLLHINSDALLFGSLNNASTFPFENFNQKIKMFLHSHNFYLEQSAKRIIEFEKVENEKCAFLVKNSANLLSKILCKVGENCLRLKDGRIILILSVLDNNVNSNIYKCKVVEYLSLRNVKFYPVDSSELGIYLVSNPSKEFDMELYENQIMYRYVRLPVDSKFVCIPLLHSIN